MALAKRINSSKTSSPTISFFFPRMLKGSKTLASRTSLFPNSGPLIPLDISLNEASSSFFVYSNAGAEAKGIPSLIKRMDFFPGKSFIIFVRAKISPNVFSNFILSLTRYSCFMYALDISNCRESGGSGIPASLDTATSSPASLYILIASRELSNQIRPEALTIAFLMSSASVVKGCRIVNGLSSLI